MDPLFEEYRATPRSEALGPTVFANVRKAWLWTFGTLAGAMCLGVPLSFFHFHRAGSTAVYRPWAPSDMVIAGLILAVFTVPIPAALAVIMRKYVDLFRAGRLVEGAVVAREGADAVVRVAGATGPDLTLVPSFGAPVGVRVPVIIGGLTSAHALVVVARGDVRRGSLLTSDQLRSALALRGSPTT